MPRKSLYDTVESIIDEEFDAALKRIEERITPLVQARANRVKAKYPDFLRVVIGNGSYTFSFTKGTKRDKETGFNGRGIDALPKPFRELSDVVGLCSYWRNTYQLIDDIVPE